MTEAERRTYLRSTLPPGALTMFSVLSGNRGMHIICPHCDAKPIHGIRPWNRWRWMAAHIANHKGGI
jgi:DNA primase